MTTVRVVIADDHPVVRDGIRSILSSADAGIEVVGEASTGAEALRLVEERAPDVLLLDVEMPEGSGVDVARELERLGSSTRILALSSHEKQEYVRGLLESGAAGYLTKEKAPFLICEAIQAVARGEVRWFVKPGREPELIEQLSSREKDVLRLMAQGYSNLQISDRLNVSESTTRKHASQVYQKLGVSSAREAIAWAWQNGVVGEL